MRPLSERNRAFSARILTAEVVIFNCDYLADIVQRNAECEDLISIVTYVICLPYLTAEKGVKSAPPKEFVDEFHPCEKAFFSWPPSF
jgi:hypothetical protein